ncbi:MAG: hypothetical protein HW419_2546 [Deltaproteobacteria bacterium]|nr:hypothetical protein [Deltaproteobacteria bacterium]
MDGKMTATAKNTLMHGTPSYIWTNDKVVAKEP